ncbi:MAG TPA: hypothetical protein VJR89_37385 [Polyangiales bacterium]|nr:hypothetical protein [Polyangiales bacterium]
MTSAEKRASQAPLPPDELADESSPLEDEAAHTESSVDADAPEEREVRVSGPAPAGTYAAETAHEPHHIDHDDPLADAFFRHPDKPVIDVWEETHTPRAMSRGSRRAMYASLGIFAVSLIAIGSYAAYHTLIMPSPVELGAHTDEPATAVLPTPLAAAPEPEPAPKLETPPQPTAAETPEPGPVQDTTPTLAALAARQPSPEQKAAGGQIDGVVGAHLLATAAAERQELERPSAKAIPAITPPAPEPAAARPAPRTTAGGPTYDELVELGQLLAKKNRRIEASEAFRRALLHSPQGSAALSGLAFVYLNADQNQEARDYARRAVQVDAGNSEGWIVLGAALELLGDKVASQEAYKSCVAQGHGPYAAQCRQVVR